MAILIGGQGTGNLDTSLFVLNRGDQTGNANGAHGDQIFVNVSNGNLIIQHTDMYLPSQGEDSILTRTYNARGIPTDTQQGGGTRWSATPFLKLEERQDNNGTYFELRQGDGTLFLYRYNEATGLYESDNGGGAFETIEDLNVNQPNRPAFVLTRADQTRIEFDKQGRIIRSVDTNGNEITYEYKSSRLTTVTDDTGHVLNYEFEGNKLVRIVDETEGAQVEYRYEGQQLVEVIDRMGHSTQYFYTNNGFLERILLPETQDADGDGQLETYARREILFEYEMVNWGGGGESFNDNRGRVQTLTRITDADGQITTFDYDLLIGNPPPDGETGALNKKFAKGGVPGKPGDPGKPSDPADDKFYDGGTTRVVDALGNARAYSNEQEYQDWRTENGFYGVYDGTLEEGDPGYAGQLSQAESIRDAHAMVYSYGENGYLSTVIDQQGFHTTYEYDDRDNLTALTDRNGWGATNSDSAYYRELRAELGYTGVGGLGKLVADLSAAEVEALLEAYTSHFEYDERGNLISRTDNEDNLTTFTYADFNKVLSSTAAMGHALTTSDDQFYQDKRVELGYAALTADLSGADVDALLELYTTRFSYDGNQNLIETVSPGGDITRYEYDSYGNRTKTIVFLDASDLTDPAKQQISTFQYDLFGNLVQTVNGEGDVNTFQYDHFGNLLSTVDGNGGETRYAYDADNRLLSIVDPEGHTTANAYDAVGNRIAVTDANGHTVTRIYDLNDRLITIIDPSETSAARTRTTEFEYDVVGSNTTVVDAEGRETTYVFDTRRQLVESITSEVVAADGTTLTQYSSTFAYDGEQNVVTTNNNRGFTTQVLYDQNGLLLQTTDAIGQVTRFQYDANLNTVVITAGAQLASAKRQILRFGFDEEDQLIAQTDAEGETTVTEYDAPGTEQSITDANGNTRNFVYDKANRLIREVLPEVTDPLSGLPVRYTIETRYDGNGNAVEIINENGESSSFAFDKNDQLVLAEDANGVKTVFAYDSRANNTSVQIGVEASVDTDGNVIVTDVEDAQVTTNRYDEFNQLIAIVDGVGNALAESDAPLYQELRQDLGLPALVGDLSNAQKALLRSRHTTRLTYDRVGNQVTERDNLNRLTTFEFDTLNRVVARTDATGRTDERTTLFRYDGNGNQVGFTDAELRVSEFEYDAVDRQTLLTDPLGIERKTEYDSFGNVTAETRAFGTVEARRTEFVYDLNNRLLSETDPLGHTRSIEYDAVGNRVKFTDARGKATDFLFDALDRNIKIIDPLNFETKFEYDGVGNQISLIDARGGITRFDYDPGNRQIRLTDAEGRIVEFEYDVRGNVIQRTTGVGTTGPGSLGPEVTVFEYDAEANLRSVTDAKGKVDKTGYDRVYNVIETTDRNGNVTQTRYDALNRAVVITDALGNQTKFTYDAVDNRLTQEDALGRIITFAYDDNDRLMTQTDPDLVQTVYSYDEVANAKTITQAAGTADEATVSFKYDLDDRLIEQADALGNKTIYTYDKEDNLKTTKDPEGNVTTFGYDATGQLKTITDAEGYVVQYAYDGNGNRNQVIDGEGNVTTTYFNANNETSLVVDGEGYAFSSEYDAQGNVISQTLFQTALATPADPAVEPVPAPSADDQTTRFVYDKLNRLITQISAEGYEQELVYDSVGNRIELRQEQDLAGTKVAITRSYFDPLNREIARMTPEAYLVTYAYDAVGNQTEEILYSERVAVPPVGSVPAPVPGDTGRLTTFQYDLNNLLRKEIGPSSTTEYSYDLRGNQVRIDEAVGTPAARTTEFTYDKANRLFETLFPDQTVTRLVLDGNGQVLEQYEAFGTPEVRITVFEYDDVLNQVRQEIVGLTGSVTTFGYDGAKNLTQKISAVGQPEQRTETFDYDGNNRQIWQEDGIGERIYFEYDGAGNQTKTTQSLGQPAERNNEFEYDLDNREVGFVNGNGDRTEYEYDGRGNRTASIQFVGPSQVERRTDYEYDLENRLVKVTSPEMSVTQYVYDVLGNKVQEIDANGGVTNRTFDSEGRVLTELTPGNVLFVFTYDALGNLLTRTQGFASPTAITTLDAVEFGAPDVFALNGSPFSGDSRTETFKYDEFGRVIENTDGEGYTTKIEYDDFGNQTRLIRGLYLPEPGDPGYNAEKDLLSFEEDSAPTLSYTYDQRNRVETATDGEGNVTLYEYNGNSNRVKEVDARGTALVTSDDQVHRDKRVELGYDEFVADLSNRDIRELKALYTKTYVYDRAGNLKSITNAEGGIKEFRDYRNGDAWEVRTLQSGDPNASTDVWIVETFVYDGNGNQTVAIDGEGYRTDRVFDANDNLIEETVWANGTTTEQRTTTFEFNLDNYLIATTDAEGNRTEFERDDLGNRTKVTDALGRSAHFFYFPGSNNLRAIVDAEGYVNEFKYDADNNRTEVRVWLDKYSGPLDSYVPPGQPADRIITTTYDAADNITTVTLADGQVIEYTNDAAGRMLVRETLSSAGGSTPDSRVETFTYDLNGRLKTVTDVDGTVTTLTYDEVSNKIREDIAAASGYNDAHPVRANVFEYDANNRLVTEIVDPDGLNIAQLLQYDKIGNVVLKIDANGTNVASTFDLNNQLKTVTVDPSGLALLTSFAYDGVGNQTSMTDARNFTANFEYDLNNRLVKEILPAVTTFDNVNELQTNVRPTTENVYDAVGNLVQIIDPNGSMTTRYYNGNDQIAFEIRGDNSLVQFAYNGANELIEERLYMDRLSETAQDPATVPTVPGGDVRITNREYDDGGRLIRVINPEIEVTSVVFTDTSVVSGAPSTFRPQEFLVYNGFGEVIETFDRNAVGDQPENAPLNPTNFADPDNRHVTYYDDKGRVIATVNAEGFLFEWDYDAQDNIVEQRQYKQSLDMSALDTSVPPDASGLGAPETVTSTYDAINRLTTQTSGVFDALTVNATTPASSTSAPTRQVTSYTYDSMGNQTSRTRAAGSGLDLTDYFYYDAAGRQVGFVNEERVLHEYKYDKTGNQTLQRRYYDPVDSRITDLGAATMTALLGNVTADNNNDQATAFEFDAAARMTRETDRMVLGLPSDNLEKETFYDAGGNATKKIDEADNESITAYDGLNRATFTKTPDGGGNVVKYNAAGEAVQVYTGEVANTLRPASIDSVVFDNVGTSSTTDDEFALGWTVPNTDQEVQTYVVYGTSSNLAVDESDDDLGYGSKSGNGSSYGDLAGSVAISSTGFAPNTRVYFRIVSVDGAQNKAWSKEESFFVPPRFSDVQVSQPTDGQIKVQVTFDAAPSSPQLLISGQTPQNLVDEGAGIYSATVTVTGDPKTLSYQISWSDSEGTAYLSQNVPLIAADSEIGTYTTISETGGLSLTTKIASGEIDLLVVRGRADSSTGWTNLGETPASSTAAGVDIFDVNLPSVPAGPYQVQLRGVRPDGTTVVLDRFDLAVGSSDGIVFQSLSWTLPEVGDDPDVGNNQLVVLDGQQVNSTRDSGEGRLLVDGTIAPASTVDFAVFYGNDAGMHNVTVDQTVVTQSFDDNGDTKYRITGYRLTVDATGLPGGAKVAWRAAGSGIDFSNEANPGQSFSVVTSGSMPQEFDIKVFYFDSTGNEVIVDWRRVVVDGDPVGTVKNNNPAGTTEIVNENVTALTVLAKEIDATVSRGANSTDDAYSFGRGLYTGPVSDETVVSALTLSPVETDNVDNIEDTSNGGGLNAGYFIENEYNLNGDRIATNQGSGIWRRFGVDANGNAVATYAYGTKVAEEAGGNVITTYTRFNNRNYETGEYGASVTFDADGNGTNESTGRAISLFERDFLDRIVGETSPLGTVTATQYNALGLVTSEIATSSGVLSSVTKSYDVLGNEVKVVDGNSNASYMLYDGMRMVTEVDALGARTEYQYDSFGRHTGTTTAAIQTNVDGTTANAQIGMTYDQRDRLVNVNDGEGEDTRYQYDSRDNRVNVIDAEGHSFGTTFDNMNRVTALTSTQNGTPVTELRAYDFFNNVTQLTDAMSRVSTTTYGAFGRKSSETDEGGRVTNFTYDAFGRLLTRVGANSGQNITNDYDDAGRLLSITDATTSVNTTYTYDVDGNRSHENIRGTGGHDRTISYTYDGLGRMTAWSDTALSPDQNLSYLYDGAGNLRRVSGSNSTNHWYHYDANNRQIAKTDGADLASSTKELEYTYDAAGNRISENTTQYAYDLNQRVVAAGTTLKWEYDDVGNVRKFTNDGDVTTYTYYENNRSYVTNDGGAESVTTLTLDLSGRVTRTVIVDSSGDDDPVTSTYTHTYSADGRELSVSGSGGNDSAGSSSLTYDANDNLSRINLGKGDTQDSAETKDFVYNNQNQILFRDAETGETADSVGDDATPRPDSETEFFYANNNPVGQSETEIDEDSNRTTTVTLDEGRYNLVREIGEDYPVTTPIAYNVQRGDTLEIIADRLYGNASLWFVIAEANGLKGSESLKDGTLLQVPNTVNSGRITDETHVVYDQNEITGSTLPNLKSPDPSVCETILAVILIILIIIVAVVVAVATAGAASAISGAIAAAGITGVAGTLLTIAAVAVAGAAIAFVGSLVTQGLLIAFGVQDEIDWASVGAETLAGAFSGIAAGIGQAVKVAVTAGKLASLGVKTANAVKVLAVVGSAAADAGGEALRQFIVDGEITSFASIAGAAVGAGLNTASIVKSASSGAKAASKAAALGRNLDGVTDAATKAAKVTSARFDVVSAAAGVVTEWVKVAEIAIRNDGEVTTADWATAIAGTVAAGVSVGFSLTSKNAAGKRQFDADGAFKKGALGNIARTGNAADATGANLPKPAALRNLGELNGKPVPNTPRVQGASTRLDAAQGSLITKRAELGDANADLAGARRTFDAEDAQLGRRNAELTAANTELNSRRTALSDQTDIKAARQLDLDTANGRVDTLDAEVQDLSSRVRSLSDSVDELTAQRNALELEIDGFAKQDVSARAKAFDDASLNNGPVDSLNTRFAETDQRLRSQQQLLQQGNETLAGKQRQLATAQEQARGARGDLDSQTARVETETRNVNRQSDTVDLATRNRDAQQNTVDTARQEQVRLQGVVDDLNVELTTNTGLRDFASSELARARDQAVKIGDVIKSPVKLDSAREEAVSAIKDTITGQIIDRGVDVLTTLVLRAAFDANTAFGFLATGRLGATNTGQSGRAALADAFSKGLITTSGPGRAADIASPQPAAFTYNTGPLQRSFVGVPVAETVDPQFGFDALAALIGKDDQSLIPVGSA